MANNHDTSGLEALAQAAEKPERWKDCAGIYPPSEDIIRALQDVGKSVASRTKAGKEAKLQMTKFTQVEKLASNIYRKIKDIYKPPGLTENVSRGKKALMLDIINSRKAFDTTDVMIEFHQYNKQGKVLLINNSVPYAGVDQSVERFQCHIEDSVKRKDAQRTPDDGLRCAAIMLDPKYRGTVSGIMSNKKDRSKSDIAGDHVENFFADAVIDFLNPAYQVCQPSEANVRGFPEEDRASWGPNNVSILEHERDGKWLMDTWFQYIKPKYRQSLNKWNKETGGGSGEVTDFIDFCNTDRWLGWIFSLDYEANFLLAASTCGKMPAHLQMESGFDDISDLEEDATRSTRSTLTSGTRSSAKASIVEGQCNLNNLNQLVGQIFAGRATGSSAVKCPDTPEQPSFHFCMERAACYREEIKQIEEDTTLSPDTREFTLGLLRKKKKRLYKRAAEADAKRQKTTGEDDSDED